MPPVRLLASLLALAMLASCSPRYSLHEVVAPGFEVEDEAYVRTEAGLTFAYDFWGSEGVPFVAIYNETADTAYVHLTRSTVRTHAGSFSLAEVLSGGFGDARAIRDAYPRLVVQRRPLRLALLPGQWTEFYGAPQVDGPSFVGYGGRRRRSSSTYAYEVVGARGAPATVAHDFSDYVTERLRRRGFETATRATPRPNVYYLDRDPHRIATALEFGTGLVNLVWIL